VLTLLKNLLVLSVLSSPFVIEHDELKGVWIGVADQDPSVNHAYLKIDESNSGRFVFVAEGREIFNFSFDSSDVAEPEGYIRIRKSFGSWGAIVVVSGWVSGEDRGLGMITGYLFMYTTEGQKTQVFNSFPLMMWAVTGPVPADIANPDDIRRFAEKYEQNSPAE